MANDITISKGYTILMFGQKPFSLDFRTRSGQFLKYLNLDLRIDSILYINPYFCSITLLSLLKNLILNILSFSIFVSIKEVKKYPKIKILNILNFKRLNFLKKYFYHLLLEVLNRNESPNKEKTIVWLYNPAEYEIFDLFPEAIKIFDTIDNWEEMNFDPKKYKWYNQQAISEGYRKLGAIDGMIIISNGKEMTEFYCRNGVEKNKIIEISNGIDTNLFSVKNINKEGIPKDLKRCKHPIIGYVGILQERFDLTLFKFLVENNPEYSFVIIGKIKQFRNFKFNINSPNLFMLGLKPYSEIPHYIYNFDICIIPHKIDSMTNYMNPMKIYEYLAMDKPVVTTSIGGIEEVSQYCLVAHDYGEFNTMLKNAISIGVHRFSEEKLRNISWETKANILMDFISEQYD